MSLLVWVYKSQDFAQTQQNFARLHDRVTVTFRNSGYQLDSYFKLILQCSGC